MRRMLTQKCTVLRFKPLKDEYGTPIEVDQDNWEEIGTYPCYLSRKSIRAVQGAPENRTEEVFMLYLQASANILGGDLVVIEGVGKYKASTPYRPNGRHTEVQVEWDGPL